MKFGSVQEADLIGFLYQNRDKIEYEIDIAFAFDTSGLFVKSNVPVLLLVLLPA